MIRRLLVVVAAMLLLVPPGTSPAVATSEIRGTQVWATRYDGPVSHADAASDAVLSPDGSILFVTGISNGGAATHTDTATLAYDAATGAQLWEQRYDRSGRRDGYGELVVSPDGSMLFVRTESWSRREQITEWTILAYDASTGAPIWVTRSTRLTYFDIAIGPDGSTLFVTGSDLTGSDFATAAYDASTGTRRWVVRYGPGEAANGIEVSPDGATLFVTGSTDESRFPLVRSDFATVAYGAANGERLWASAYDGGRGDYPSALDLSADGSTVFVTGSSRHAGWQQQAYGTVAYHASTGAELWRTRYLGPPSGPDVPRALAASPDGSAIFVTGWSTGSELDGDEDYDFATVAYDAATGTELWVKRYDGRGDDGLAQASAIAVSPDSATVIVTGSRTDGPDQPVDQDYATVAYDALTGASLWTRRYDGASNGEFFPIDAGRALVISPDGSTAFVTGGSAGTTTRRDYATVAYRV